MNTEESGGRYDDEDPPGDLTSKDDILMNSNKPISPNVRFLKNAQVPPNVKVPPNQFKTENAHGMKVGEAFDSFSADGLQPGELEGEDRTMTPFPRKEFAFVTEAMNELVEEGDMIFKAHGGITSLEQWDVMELCCDPTSLLTEEVIRQGGRAGRAGLHNQCDLTKPEGVERTLALLRQHRPRWIWVSFPCGPTSAVQALNERTPEGKVKSAYRKRHARKVLRGVYKNTSPWMARSPGNGQDSTRHGNFLKWLHFGKLFINVTVLTKCLAMAVCLASRLQMAL